MNMSKYLKRLIESKSYPIKQLVRESNYETLYSIYDIYNIGGCMPDTDPDVFINDWIEFGDEGSHGMDEDGEEVFVNSEIAIAYADYIHPDFKLDMRFWLINNFNNTH